MPISDESHQAISERPLIFISCGQYTADEISIGKSLERLVRESTSYDAYFAEVQNSLEGLTTNIFASLQRCVGLVAVAHHRGRVQRPDGEIVRASVWIEQEIAIAAFIQYALKRKIEVALYLRRGICREGIREQLRLNPIEFDSAEEVIEDFRLRLARWTLVSTPDLIAQWRFECERQTQDQHDYRLVIDLVNTGKTLITDWRVRVELPSAFARVGQGESDVVTIQEDSASLLAEEAKLYGGETRRDVLPVRYYIDSKNYDTIGPDQPALTLSVWSGNSSPWVRTIPLSELNEF